MAVHPDRVGEVAGGDDASRIHDVVARRALEQGHVVRARRQLAPVGDGVVDARDRHLEAMGPGGVGVDADHPVLVDRVGRGDVRAGKGDRNPGLSPLGVDVQHRRLQLPVVADPVRHEVVCAAAARAGDALEMGEDRVGMVVGGPAPGPHVVDVAVLEARLAVRPQGAVTARDLVAPDAVGSGADRAAAVVGDVGPAGDVVDEGVSRQGPGVVIADDRVPEGAVGDGEPGVGIRIDEGQRIGPGRRRPVVEIAQIDRRRVGLVASDDAQDPARRPEARTIR